MKSHKNKHAMRNVFADRWSLLIHRNKRNNTHNAHIEKLQRRMKFKNKLKIIIKKNNNNSINDDDGGGGGGGRRNGVRSNNKHDYIVMAIEILECMK